MNRLRWLLSFVGVIALALSGKLPVEAYIFFIFIVPLILFFNNRVKGGFLAGIVQAGGNPDKCSGIAKYEEIEYRHEYTPTGVLSSKYASFMLQVTTLIPGSFKVSKKKLISSRGFERSIIVHTGDDAFDRDFLIESASPEYVTAVFKIRENREAIRGIFAHGYTAIEQVGTNLKATWEYITTDDPGKDVVTFVVPRLALLGGARSEALDKIINQSERDTPVFISPSGVVIKKKVCRGACAGAFLFTAGFFTLAGAMDF